MKIVIMDIETRANEEAIALMPPPVVKAPANYKSQEKIDRYIAEKTEQKVQELHSRAGLDPDTGLVSSVGIYPLGEATNICIGHDEADLLTFAWSNLKSAHYIVGYNLLQFDLPYLLRRSMHNDLRPSVIPDLRKFQSPPRGRIIDLMQILYSWGGHRFKGLATVADLAGFANRPVGSGGDLETMSQDEEMEHLENDLKTTAELFHRMDGIYWPSILR